MTHTLIIGAGITGAALAYALSRRGDRVTLVTAHPRGGDASAASFSWLNASFYLNDAHFSLRQAGLAAHRHLQTFLPDLPISWPGCLWYETTGEAFEATAASLAARDYPVKRLSGAEVAGLVPALGVVPQNALLFPGEGVADPAALARALLSASGAQVIRATVTRLSESQGRVTGVTTDQGPILADRVILAAGTGTPDLLRPLGYTLPMLTRPGMIIATEPLPPLCPLILVSPDQEVRQDADGRLIAPAAAAHQSDTAEVLASFPVLVNATLGRLRSLFPAHDIRFARHALAMRPVPGDGLPIVGSGPLENLWLAVMHSGATLGPVVAELLAQEIAEGSESELLVAFRPSRFQARTVAKT